MAERIGCEGFLRQQTAILNRVDNRPGLADIACPTLVLTGRQDLLTPVEVHLEIAAAIPAATLVVLPNCGHLSTLEQPAMVNGRLAAWARRLIRRRARRQPGRPRALEVAALPGIAAHREQRPRLALALDASGPGTRRHRSDRRASLPSRH
jgi:hypothetical protein